MRMGFFNGEVCAEKVCHAKVYNARTLTECPSENTHGYDLDGQLLAKVPVVIAEPRIQIDVESEIELDEPALEIKRIKKNLYLTQCKLLSTENKKKGKLFIGGFIRKNIEYATVLGKSCFNQSLYGDIRHTTVKIPFECVTTVDFICPPEFCEGTFSKEIEIFSDKIGASCDPCEEKILGKDPCEQEFRHFECFSEKVFCELVDVKIIEGDFRKNPVTLCNQSPGEQLFDCFVEKMVIYVRLKLLQNQQVKMPGHCFQCKKKEDGGKKKSFCRRKCDD